MIQLTDKDWAFADLILPVGIHNFAGIQSNIKKLIIADGATVFVEPYDPTTSDSILNPEGPKYGSLEFRALEVEINGTIDASGAGYFGGGGGGGGGALNGTSLDSAKTIGGGGGITPSWTQNYFPAKDGGNGGNGGQGGNNAYSILCTDGSDGSDGRFGLTGLVGGGTGGTGGAKDPTENCGGGGGGGGGGGEFGGNGGNGGTASVSTPSPGFEGIIGGYSDTGINGDTSTDDTILMGSGGGGGGGAGSLASDRSGVGGGASGQRGGGKIALIFYRTFILSTTGKILSNSKGSGNGGDGCYTSDVVSGGPGGGGSVFIANMISGYGRNNGTVGIGGYAYDIINGIRNLGSNGSFVGDSLGGQIYSAEGGNGGIGAGGGILIKFERKYNALSAVEVQILGTINNYGGLGTVVTNGGTLKIVDIPASNSLIKTGTIKTGRVDGTGFVRYKPKGVMVL